MTKPKDKAKPKAAAQPKLSASDQALIDAFSAKINGSGDAQPADSTDDPLIYEGVTAGSKPSPTAADHGVKAVKAGQEITRKSSEAISQFYSWTDAQRKEWGQYLVAQGIIAPSKAGDFDTLKDAWTQAVGDAASYYAVGKRISPKDTIKARAAIATAQGGATTTTSTEKVVDLTDPTSAKALVNSVLSSQLGREATPEEISSFTKVLNSAESATPATAVTTATDNGNGTTTASTTKSGGLSADGKTQLLVDQARKNPEYGAYQAASTYYNAFLGAIGAPVKS